MVSEKEIKKRINQETKTNPEKYFPVKKLKEFGFKRYQCSKCGRFFWSAKKRDVCGDINCEGSFSFIGKKSKVDLDFIKVWKRFEEMFTSFGYASIKRYPVVARWNPTMDFTIASIADFQPYVVNGDIEPPAEKLIIPQLCLRFNDIDNVGITGSHYTGFTMIGQHAFLPSEDFKQEMFFEDYYRWFTEGLKLDKTEFVIHEDGWAGGGNAGPCLEYFSHGLEIGNQVYHQYKINSDGSMSPLKLKVLDMGMGHERVVWFTKGSLTSYDVVMPTSVNYLKEIAPFDINQEIISKFVPYSGKLNYDEISNIGEMWNQIGSDINVTVPELKYNVLRSAAIYSIADHTRTLLYSLSDGAIPSNVGGGYNLRVIFRRAYDFAEKYKIPVDWHKLLKLHADYLKPIYPELSENIDDCSKIIDVEISKYKETKEKNSRIIEKIAKQSEKGEKFTDFITYYDRYGISPEDIEKVFSEKGIEIKIPDNFFSQVNKIHDTGKTEKTQTSREFPYDVSKIENTKALYFEDFKLTDFEAKVIKKYGNYIILDKTAFYPTSGGQAHDSGKIKGIKVKDIFKYEGKIIHELESSDNIFENETVKCEIDFEKRLQLSQHHTAVHVVNGACRRVLGNHVWQAGAAKTIEKARLDITHYQALSDEDIKKIEDLSNGIIKKNLPVYKSVMGRSLAEARFGFKIYQGGFVPGKSLRIVEIPKWDVEACGGTHVDLTGDLETIRIIKTSKVQDGVIRLEIAAGKAAEKINEAEEKTIKELSEKLTCSTKDIVPRIEELFLKWKQIVKKKQDMKFSLDAKGTDDLTASEIIKKSASILSTQGEHVAKTVERFLSDIKKRQEK